MLRGLLVYLSGGRGQGETYAVDVETGGARCLIRVGVEGENGRRPLVAVLVHQERSLLFVRLCIYVSNLNAYIGRSDDLVSVTFCAQKQDSLGHRTNPPRVEGEMGVGPVNANSVVRLSGSNLALEWVSQMFFEKGRKTYQAK